MTMIVIHRKPITARLRTSLTTRLSMIAALTHNVRPARLKRPGVLDLDERMLRDIGMSRGEFMAADIDG